MSYAVAGRIIYLCLPVMRFYLWIVIVLFCVTKSDAKVARDLYGIRISGTDSVVASKGVTKDFDSAMGQHPLLASQRVIYDIESSHAAGWQSGTFYSIIVLFLFAGVIKAIDPRYFANLWKAMLSPRASSQITDQLENAGIQNLLMNFFFSIVSGLYLFYVVRYFFAGNISLFSAPIVNLLLVGAVLGLYMLKYLAITFSGWAFRVQAITTEYLFNVFLINKVMGLILLPAVVFMAFGDPAWQQAILLTSFIITGIFLTVRYVRSWQVFGSFLQFSKFHFFLYLCASELLPVSVLVKFLVRYLHSV